MVKMLLLLSKLHFLTYFRINLQCIMKIEAFFKLSVCFRPSAAAHVSLMYAFSSHCLIIPHRFIVEGYPSMTPFLLSTRVYAFINQWGTGCHTGQQLFHF